LTPENLSMLTDVVPSLLWFVTEMTDRKEFSFKISSAVIVCSVLSSSPFVSFIFDHRETVQEVSRSDIITKTHVNFSFFMAPVVSLKYAAVCGLP
jgi:hypothetical protein